MSRGAADDRLSPIPLRRKTPQLNTEFKATDDEIDYFMFGSCHKLALAIHQRTNWPLAGCDWREWIDDGETYQIPGHVFVIAPDGEGVDIHGKHPRGRHPDREIGDDWEQFDPEEIIKLIGEEDVYLPEGAVEDALSRMLTY